MSFRLGVVASHPIQYQSPYFRALAKRADLRVLYAHNATAAQQSGAGYGVAFEWDVDLLSGFESRFLTNVAADPGTHHWSGCDTPELFTEIRRSRYDGILVSGWGNKSYAQTLAACKWANVPLLVRGDSELNTPRSTFKKIVKRGTHKALLSLYSAHLFVGERNHEYLRHYGVPESKLFFAPHAVDNQFFSAEAIKARGSRDAVRAQLGFSNTAKVACFVGRLIDLKRVEDLLVALARVATTEEVAVLIVGAGPKGDELRARAHALGLNSAFVGFKNQSELPTYYAASDFMVLPSAHETWGLVVNEAMASGLPAIVSERCGCVPDLVEDATGRSYPVGNVGALAEAIHSLLPELGTDRVRKALANKMERYNAERAANGTLTALAACVRRL